MTKEQAAKYWRAYSRRPNVVKRNRVRQKERCKKHGDVLARIKDVPCADCGGRFHHSVMEFDHRPGTEKLLSIGRMKSIALSKLLAETEKCDIVCANCHALRTWKRVQSPDDVSSMTGLNAPGSVG